MHAHIHNCPRSSTQIQEINLALPPLPPILTLQNRTVAYLRWTICRLRFSRAFQAAGGEFLEGSGDSEVWLRGERRTADTRVGSCLADGDIGWTVEFLEWVRVVAGGGCGEERHDRSMVSISGDVFLAATGFGDVRSKMSTSGKADSILRSRGDVRPVRVLVEAFLQPLDLAEVDDAEPVDSEEALEDMEVRGGREGKVAAVRRGLEKTSGACTGRIGEDSVKSSSSISVCDG
jgi:hypothetical protein